ncbi:MAG: hypothetical protein ACP5RH_11915 [Leptodesmis sp.]|uniref:hypothetical protein n=1 Tax=Leptodesmis sp. TaxID=3100501 RepID=UPI003D117123
MMIRISNDFIRERLQLITLILAILPAIIIGFLITQNWVNIPWVDQWNTPGGVFIKIHEGSLTPDYLISQHNESRLLIYRLISVPLAFLTHWDVRYEILLIFLVACGISISFYRLITLTCSRNRVVQLLLISAINLLIFSPIQLDPTGNWLMGIQVIMFLVVLCIALCVLIAYSRLRLYLKFLLCVILALVSTFSFANGILCWIVVFPPLIILSVSSWKEILERKKLFLAWLFCFALTLYVYFHDFKRPHIASNPMDSLSHPLKALLFFFSFLGSPLGFKNLLISQIVGLILVLLFVSICLYLIRFHSDFRLIQNSIGWLAFSLYVILSSVIVTLGRLGDGMQSSLYAKYTTVSIYFTVSIIGLIYIIVSHARANRYFFKHSLLLQRTLITLGIVGLVLQGLSFFHGVKSMKEQRLNLLAGKACLLLINVVKNDDCLIKHVYPLVQVENWNSLEYIKSSVPIINEMKLLSPSLIKSSKIRAINGNQNLPVGDGVFENLTIASPGQYIATGSLNIHSNQNIGGVVLAYADQKNDATVFAIADLVLGAPVNVTSTKATMVWQAKFSSDQIPDRPTQITAWAVDTDTGKMFKLQQKQPDFRIPG